MTTLCSKKISESSTGSFRVPVERVMVSIALIGLLSVTLTDCLSTQAPAPAGPTRATIPIPSLRVHDQAEVTRDGITITLAPITADNFRRFPQAHRRVAWTRTVQQGSQSVQVPGGTDANVIPLPSFQIRIANHTGHVIRFTATIFRLQDNLGRTYPTFAGTSDLVAWNEGVWATTVANAPELLTQILPQVRSAVGQLQLLSRSTELLNGDEWSGYLVFNVNVATTEEYLALLNSVARFTLRLAEIPVAVNEAGAPTRTTEFTFALDRTEESVSATCPPGITTPMLSVCNW